MQTSKIKIGDKYAVQTRQHGVQLVTIATIINTQERTGVTNSMTGHFFVIGEDGQQKTMLVTDIRPKEIIEAADVYEAAQAERQRVSDAHQAKRAAVIAQRDKAGALLAAALGIPYIAERYGKERTLWEHYKPYVVGDGDGLELTPEAVPLLLDWLAHTVNVPVGN